ncbi:hypothetical protein JKF63_05138 [Porcisia hertigi]|uniref:Uncharacterized protein n=1 Tax=Porcisia hertigi TaxID=2761500 RepID=A0A836IHS5_9TRYP|nr:hypothetical protein JKF63_05138 [Porcisia hertigi]
MSSNASPVTRLSSSSSFRAFSPAKSGSAPTSAGATSARGGDCSRHHSHLHHHNVTSAGRTDTVSQTCFYFTVFFSNNPPIFHSNRIPPAKLGIGTRGTSQAREPAWPAARGAPASSLSASTDGLADGTPSSIPYSQCTVCQEQYWKTVFGEPRASRAARPWIGNPYADGLCTAGPEAEEGGDGCAAVVGDYRSATATVEEVPQQTLQTVAFPTTFGSCDRSCAYPIRAFGRHKQNASAVSSPTVSLQALPILPQTSPSQPQPLPSPSSCATGAEITRAANANGSIQQGTSVCTQSHAAGAPTALVDATPHPVGSFDSTLSAASVNDVKASEAATEGVQSTAGAACVSSHPTPVCADAGWSCEDTVAARTFSNEDTETSDSCRGPQQRRGRVRARRPRPLIATGTTSRHAEGQAPPLPWNATSSAAPALTAALGVSPITSSPTAPQTGTVTRDDTVRPLSLTGAVTNALTSSATQQQQQQQQQQQEGPPWNMRMEEVRSAKGELRYYRIILTVSFAALITRHTGLMHSMQTRHAAAALVILCPPCGLHYRFLLHHVDVLRSVLNRTTEFSIRTVQRFFGLLYLPTQQLKGSQQQVLKGIAAQLEAHPEAVETYRAVKAELMNALRLRFPLPLLAPATSAWVVPVLMRSSLSSLRARSLMRRTSDKWTSGPLGASAALMSWLSTDDASASPVEGSSANVLSCGAASCATPQLADILHEATSFVREYSELFASAYICGILSLAKGGVGSAGLHARFSVGNNANVSDGATAASAAGIEDVSSPNVRGPSVLPGSTQFASSEKAVRESSSAPAGGGGVAASWAECVPELLSPYAAYWSSLTNQHGLQHCGDAGVIHFGQRAPVRQHGGGGAGLLERERDDVNSKDAVLVTRASGDAAPSETTGAGSLAAGAPFTLAASAHSPAASCFTEEKSRAMATADPATRFPATRDGTTAEILTSTAGMTVASGGALSRDTVNATSRSSEHGSCSPVAPPASTWVGAPAPSHPPRAAGDKASRFTAKEDEYSLHCGRLGRVVIFTQDGILARRLLIIAAFLWTCGGRGDALDGGVVARSGAPGRPCATGPRHSTDSITEEAALRNGEARHMYETAVAAGVSSAEHANVPIQWVAEEFSEARLCTLCSRFSPENALLVVVPRQLQCRRVYLRKYVAGTTVLVEEHSGKGARICSPPFPFRCSIPKQVVVQPDPTVTTLLREACSLHTKSHGAVSFADVFQRMVRWLHWQSAAAVLAREAHTQGVATTRATSVSTTANGTSLVRLASTDAIWPSSDTVLGAATSCPVARMHHENACRKTMPVVTSPAMRVMHEGNTYASSPVNRCDASYDLNSVEEALLPGSKCDAGAWAYATGASTNATCGVASEASTTTPRTELTPSTSMLLASQGLLKPPSAFITASRSAASPARTTSLSSLKFFNWFHSSPTSTSTAVTQSHPILSPIMLGQMYSANGGVDGQLQRLLAGADDDVVGDRGFIT